MKWIFIALTALSLPAFASEGTRGGGDACEERFKAVRNDISDWIADGGGDGLQLPSGWTKTKYSKKMTSSLATARIQCVGKGDRGYPVEIDGVPKICRFDISSKSTWITCDLTKFMSLSETDQYRLVHHEYAGLVGLESPRGSDSFYEVSDQITNDLVDETHKKLAVGRRVGKYDSKLDLGSLPGVIIGAASPTCLDKIQNPWQTSAAGPSLYIPAVSLVWRVPFVDFFLAAYRIEITGSNIVDGRFVAYLGANEVDALFGITNSFIKGPDDAGKRFVLLSSTSLDKALTPTGMRPPPCGVAIGSIPLIDPKTPFTARVRMTVLGTALNPGGGDEVTVRSSTEVNATYE